jgi:hypothetical protein
MKGICEQCGKECKNLGAHMRFCGKVNSAPVEQHLVVDEVTPDKPLSTLISEVKELMRKYRSNVSVKVSENGGKPYEVEIIARIQL